MNKVVEVIIVLFGGAIGGVISVMDAWSDPGTFPLSLATFNAVFLIPFIKGSAAGGIGVYVLTSIDPRHMAKAFFFAVTCGLAFPSILTKSGTLADATISQVAAHRITESKNIIENAVAAAGGDVELNVSAIQQASRNIVQAAPKAGQAMRVDAMLALDQAKNALRSASNANQPEAKVAYQEVALLNSRVEQWSAIESSRLPLIDMNSHDAQLNIQVLEDKAAADTDH